jgi:radical SAM protein (TIGR01212 family)
MNYPWGHQRPFNAYAQYFEKLFGERVQKLTINAGFTCPNRDGRIAFGGCTYCNNDAFNPSYCTPEKSITQQINEGIEFHANRYRRSKKFLAYFQAYSNTYKALDELKNLYKQALENPNIIGLIIGTRPDCIDEEKLEYFASLQAKGYYVLIEYGIETTDDETLVKINRGHTFKQAVDAISLTKKYGIKCGGHFILGLPGENPDFLVRQIKIISELALDSIKFHQLQIIKNTAMEKEYLLNPENFSFFTLDKYIELIIAIVERLNPAFVIERFAGEVPPRFLVGPGWGNIRNDQILQKIETQILALNTWQGKKY